MEEFIRASFRSVWALELLGLLHDRRDKSHAPAELVSFLRASDYVIANCLENLAAMGLVTCNADGSVRYSPASPELEALATSALGLYVSSPSAVRRIIATSASPVISAFADAFRLKKDGE